MKHLVILVAAISLAACAVDDPNRRAKTGAAIGAVVGAVVGHQFNDKNGKIVGAAVGALTGAAVGNYMDKQQAELEQRLAAEAARDELRITRMTEDALRVGLASDATFDFNSSNLRSEASATYSKIGNILKDYDKTVIHVVGHTDSIGADSYNKTLSERRARSVVDYLASQGVPMDRIRMEGRGEGEPVASNQSDDGRRRNRRVDIVIKAVVEGREAQAWAPPPYLGS